MKKFMSSLLIAGAMVTGTFASAKEKSVDVLPAKNVEQKVTTEKDNDPTYCEGSFAQFTYVDSNGNGFQITEIIIVCVSW